MQQTEVEQLQASVQTLIAQNSHLLSVLGQIRNCIDPEFALAGANLDAANYALSYVFGPRGGLYGRFCPAGCCQWADARNSVIQSGEICSVCSQVRAGNQATGG